MSRRNKFAFTAIVIAAAIIFATPAHTQQNNFTVGTAVAIPNQKSTGFIVVPAGVDAATRIPVVIFRGTKPGPTLAIVSGAHGTEYASIIAVERLIATLDATKLSGTVILIPLVNIPSFEQKVPHVNPIDNKSMNRFYPGKMDGTQTDRVSFLITQQVVDKSDYLIDLHGGDLDEDLRPYSYYTISGNEKVDRVTRDLTLALSLDHLIIQTDFPRDPAASRYLSNTALTRGKPAAIAEAGHAGTVEPEDVNSLVYGSENIMRYLKMLPGDAPFVKNPVWIEKVVTVSGDQNGIFYPEVKRGTYVAAGMKIGYVTDYIGNIVQEARAPVAGVVLYICAVPTMTKGAAIANIGTIAAKEPQ